MILASNHFWSWLWGIYSAESSDSNWVEGVPRIVKPWCTCLLCFWSVCLSLCFRTDLGNMPRITVKENHEGQYHVMTWLRHCSELSMNWIELVFFRASFQIEKNQQQYIVSRSGVEQTYDKNLVLWKIVEDHPPQQHSPVSLSRTFVQLVSQTGSHWPMTTPLETRDEPSS